VLVQAAVQQSTGTRWSGFGSGFGFGFGFGFGSGFGPGEELVCPTWYGTDGRKEEKVSTRQICIVELCRDDRAEVKWDSSGTPRY
jgi:hypothetical protein